MNTYPQNFIDRFWRKVDKSGGPDACWLWTGAIDANGYGKWSVGHGIPRQMHRFAYELAHGSIPAGLYVCHHCDNPPCVNPAHLWIGTHLDNMADRQAKGRAPKGEQHGRHKFTAAQVLEIRARYAAGGVTITELAQEFSSCEQHIFDMVSGGCWKHLPVYAIDTHRNRAGERNSQARLTTAQVLAIRQRAAQGVSRRVLTAEFSCGYSTIQGIVSRRSWKHVTDLLQEPPTHQPADAAPALPVAC